MQPNHYIFSKVGRALKLSLSKRSGSLPRARHTHKRISASAAASPENRDPLVPIEQSPPKKIISHTGCSTPTVGQYSPNYSFLYKRNSCIDFSKFLPHFTGKQVKANQVTELVQEFPEKPRQKLKGSYRMEAMVSRDIKPHSTRFSLEDPHENRFILKDCINKMRSTVTMGITSPRFDPVQLSQTPFYDYSITPIKQNLNTHLLPFQNQVNRDDSTFTAPTGISNCFTSDPTRSPNKTMSWNKSSSKMEPLIPSYMGKNNRSRLAAEMLHRETYQTRQTTKNMIRG